MDKEVKKESKEVKRESNCILLALFYIALVIMLVLLLLNYFTGISFYYCFIPIGYIVIYLCVSNYIDLYKSIKGDKKTKTLITVIFISLHMPMSYAIIWLIILVTNNYIGYNIFEKLRSISTYYASIYSIIVTGVGILLIRLILPPLLHSISVVIYDLFMDIEKEMRKKLIKLFIVFLFIIFISSAAFFFIY